MDRYTRALTAGGQGGQAGQDPRREDRTRRNRDPRRFVRRPRGRRRSGPRRRHTRGHRARANTRVRWVRGTGTRVDIRAGVGAARASDRAGPRRADSIRVLPT